MKWLSGRSDGFKRFVARLSGRYRGPNDELHVCEVQVDGRVGPALYLERVVGAQVLESHLWEADAKSEPASFHELSLLPPLPANACDHSLVHVPSGSVGNAIDGSSPELDAQSLSSFVDAQGGVFERTSVGMKRWDPSRGGEPTTYVALQRGSNGQWVPSEALVEPATR